jgi:hypothetical protein
MIFELRLTQKTRTHIHLHYTSTFHITYTIHAPTHKQVHLRAQTLIHQLYLHKRT